MAGKSFEVSINPVIIKWARESSGWSGEDIIKKIRMNKENYEKIESGVKSPTFSQLEMLANYFKRPVAVFFLPGPPKEPSLATSFRILPKKEQQLSKELLLAIRKARYYQSIANELMKDLRIDTKPEITPVKPTDDPIEISQKERNRLEISIDEQLRWPDAYQAFNVWRGTLEGLNILVFQFKFPLQDARGFSLMDKEPPVIGLNSSDNILARIFTLFHEYAHILLGIPEIYAEEEEIEPTNLEVENWCNRFASELLVPEKALEEDTNFQNFISSHLLSPEILKNLSRKFKVSRHAILTRLRTLDLIEQKDYEREVISLKKPSSPPSKIGGFITPPQKCIQERGKQFVSLVLQSRERGSITTSDLIEYLSLKLKHLEKIERFIMK